MFWSQTSISINSKESHITRQSRCSQKCSQQGELSHYLPGKHVPDGHAGRPARSSGTDYVACGTTHHCGPVFALWLLRQGGPTPAAHQTHFLKEPNFHPRWSTCKNDWEITFVITLEGIRYTGQYSQVKWLSVRASVFITPRKPYLWGLSAPMDEMRIPVCTSITFTKPSAPVLRMWRLSVRHRSVTSECGLASTSHNNCISQSLPAHFPWAS